MSKALLGRIADEDYLAVQIGLGGFGRIKLQSFSNAFAQDMRRRIGFHDFCHRLLDERLHSWEPVSVR